MSKKIFGTAEIRLRGQLLLTHPGATLDPGGVSRAAVVGSNSIHGFAEKPREAKLEVEVSLRAGESVTDVLAIEDETITFRAAATGQIWILRNAWSDGESTITDAADGGKVKFAFNAPPAEEVL